jgi:hypothetical protein
MDKVTLVEKPIHLLQPGEITQMNGNWYVGCPGKNCQGVGNLTKHAVSEREGTITVTPSILCSCGAHYFIEQNTIRWC